MTQFLDFSLKSNGPSKVKSVRDIKYSEYNPATDYWKALREAIPLFHEEKMKIDYLHDLIGKVNDKKKTNYLEAITSYEKFLKRKEEKWFDPGKSFWSFGSLSVKSSPEVGLFLKGEPHLIKLYFNKEKIDKRRAKNALALLATSTTNGSVNEAKYSILDVRKGKLHLATSDHLETDVILALEAEATQFIHIWNSV
ncbi:hypothetical protein [Paenibacillus sp. 598K]|uniref:hypothetical protein n=1 Tax=Paenibacillus sp. 598K TaxID=1117987 RepID=UPI000FFE8A53|nr:hypothetical protein [Paenibacillus sp. 598K]